jgi:hypothetical protein
MPRRAASALAPPACLDVELAHLAEGAQQRQLADPGLAGDDDKPPAASGPVML